MFSKLRLKAIFQGLFVFFRAIFANLGAFQDRFMVSRVIDVLDFDR